MNYRLVNGLLQSTQVARCAVAALLLAGAASQFVGCGGGGLSANDMKRYAIKRPAEEEETPPATANVDAASDHKRALEERATPVPSAVDDDRPAVSEKVASVDRSQALASDTAIDAPSVDSRSPLDVSPDSAERTRQTVDNLQRIGTAIEAYEQDRGLYPTRAIFDASKQPLLSWRVALLPYLGYDGLYRQFRLDEPWSSRHNRALVEKIPAVYQSPERHDTRTNYLVPVSTATIFGETRGIRKARIEDGVTNTAFVVEVDNELAVPWTEPRDFDLDVRAAGQNLGSLRDDSFFVVWGGGEVGRVLASTPNDLLKAMFTFDAGEAFSAGKIDKPLFPAAATVDDADTPTASGSATAETIANPASRTPANPKTAALAAKCFEQSELARAQGREDDAAAWFYAGAIVAPPGDDWVERYQWIPALRRPTPHVRFGVGLEYSGPREQVIEKMVARTGQRRSGAGPWSAVTKELGDQIVAILSAHVEDNAAGTGIDGVPSTPARSQRRTRQSSLLSNGQTVSLAPGVDYLAVAREPVLRKAARRAGVDVLLVVSWRERANSWSAGIELIDVMRDESLLSLPRIRSTHVDEAHANPLVDNPVVDVLRHLSEFLDKRLSTEPFPEQIQPRHVLGRLKALAASEAENPLAALAEMRYYRERQLADDARLTLAYQGLVGPSDGIDLLLGDAESKERTVSQWLPARQLETRDARLSTAGGRPDRDD